MLSRGRLAHTNKRSIKIAADNKILFYLSKKSVKDLFPKTAADRRQHPASLAENG